MLKLVLLTLAVLLSIGTFTVYNYQTEVSDLEAASGARVSQEITKIAGPSSKGQCAKYVREAIQRANGVTVQPTGIVSAKDYGPWVQKYGYKATRKTYSQASVGDVAILNGQPAHKHGHIAIKCADGKWRSDFVQNNFYIYRDGSQPGYTIYTL